MNSLEFESAITWCSNKTAIENAQLLNAQHYTLLAKNKKTQSAAQKLSKQITKTKDLNPAKRPTVLSTLMKLKAKSLC